VAAGPASPAVPSESEPVTTVSSESGPETVLSSDISPGTVITVIGPDGVPTKAVMTVQR
jgi:hypothetical protein